MAVYKKKTTKKKARRKATKKKARRKKVAIKKRSLDDMIKSYKERRESNLAGNDFLSRIQDNIEALKSFSVGDIINIREWDSWDDGMAETFNCYEWDYDMTDVPIKYKIVYVDSKGFPHYVELSAHNEWSTYIRSLAGDYEDMIGDGCYVDEFDISKAYVLDPDFLDSTIFQIDYDPLAKFREVTEDKEKEVKEAVTQYRNLKAHNTKLRMYTGSDRGKNKFLRDMDIGTTVFTHEFGDMTVKIKQDDTLVFDTSYGLKVFNLPSLGNISFYSKKPEDLPYVTKEQLVKYKT
jgi:hypothetical protein